MDFHWHFDPHGKKNIHFIEWKYFNFINQDFSAFFSYNIANPKNNLNVGQAFVIGKIFFKNQVCGNRKPIKLESVKISSSDINAIFEKNFIFHNHNQIKIIGDTGPVKWSLVYEKIIDKPHQILDVAVGKTDWEKINWQVIHPLSRVKGTLKIENRNYQIDTYGYVDNNWGKFIPFKAMWNWYQIINNSKDVIITYGEILNIRERYLSIITPENNFIFRNREISINYIKWEYDQKEKIYFPEKIRINVTKPGIFFSIEVKKGVYETLNLQTYPFFPNIYINEQRISANGILKTRLQRKEIYGLGFQEYTKSGYPIFKKWKSIIRHK